MHSIRFIYILNGQPSPSTFSTRNAAYTAALLHAGSVMAGITTVGTQAMDSIKGIARAPPRHHPTPHLAPTTSPLPCGLLFFWPCCCG